ncbi:hypothetical protein [Streptomyces niveus]|uniref:hypothetical protein n=1 Tax=Streptomyces niveus TaxID=193462 RepID=UPI0036CF3408
MPLKRTVVPLLDEYRRRSRGPARPSLDRIRELITDLEQLMQMKRSVSEPSDPLSGAASTGGLASTTRMSLPLPSVAEPRRWLTVIWCSRTWLGCSRTWLGPENDVAAGDRSAASRPARYQARCSVVGQLDGVDLADVVDGGSGAD